MRAIELETVVSSDGVLAVQVPGIAPGRHKLVLVIDEVSVPQQRALLEMTPYDATTEPCDARFRREEVYGDGGR